MADEVKHPAQFTCHWPTGPVHACTQHAKENIALGRFMGGHTPAELAPEGAECSNCVNESRSKSGNAV